MQEQTGTETRLQALAKLIASELDAAPQRPKLRLIRKGDFPIQNPDALDPATRDFMCARIRDLARMYWLAWLVRQETAGVAIECLEDDDLRALLKKMETARECRVEGIGFDEAGLVREQHL